MIEQEKIFFDKRAEKLLALPDEGLIVTDPYRFLAGSRVAFDYFQEVIGDVCGKRILDVGCGSGWLSVYLAQKGAGFVHGFDVSPKMVEVARKRAKANGVSDKVEFSYDSAENVKFEKETFDYVVGISVLHHVDMEAFQSKIRGILKASGRAVFIEPLGENKIIEFVRNKINSGLLCSRTHDEEPLRLKDIEKFSDYFMVYHRGFQLFGGLARYIGDKLADSVGLNLMDRALFKLFPSTQKKARVTVIVLAPK